MKIKDRNQIMPKHPEMFMKTKKIASRHQFSGCVNDQRDRSGGWRAQHHEDKLKVHPAMLIKIKDGNKKNVLCGGFGLRDGYWRAPPGVQSAA
jgi:hypothetical protein